MDDFDNNVCCGRMNNISMGAQNRDSERQREALLDSIFMTVIVMKEQSLRSHLDVYVWGEMMLFILHNSFRVALSREKYSSCEYTRSVYGKWSIPWELLLCLAPISTITATGPVEVPKRYRGHFR